MPCDGRLMQQQFERTRARYQQFGLDYSGTFYFDGRSATNVVGNSVATAVVSKWEKALDS